MLTKLRLGFDPETHGLAKKNYLVHKPQASARGLSR